MEDFEDVRAAGLLLDGDLVYMGWKWRKKPILPVSPMSGPGFDACVMIWNEKTKFSKILPHD